MKINNQRLAQLQADFSQYGKTAAGGLNRLALSAEDKACRDALLAMATAAGFSSSIDEIGNIFIRREGRNTDLPVVLTGSHADSQPQGGCYDGMYGVMAGLEVLLTLNDHHILTDRAIELAIWTNEEGARFAPSMMGSGVFAGILPLEDTYKIADSEGITVKDALIAIDYLGSTALRDKKIYAYIEAHIEQGPILEHHNIDIGVVRGAFGIKWYEITFKGFSAHSGTTPLNLRQDALLGMAQATVFLNELGKQLENGDLRITVGRVAVSPNSPNVVADQVVFTIDMRHQQADILKRLDQEIAMGLAAIAAELNLSLEIKRTVNMAPIEFAETCISNIEKSVDELGLSYQNMISGAGHDACYISHIAPTAMIFIPCKKGISHNEAEAITDVWASNGANTLLHTLLALSVL